MKKLFGTDGIRGVAGQFPLDPITIHAVGLALAHHLGQSPRVLIGQDTRESSDWIAAALTAGLVAGGATVESAGVIPTPAVAYLARAHRFSAGVVISASHNPWVDNGIKLFGPDGYKLPDATELAIEAEIFRRLASSTGNGQRTTEQRSSSQRGRPRRVHPLAAERSPGSFARRTAHRHRLRQWRRLRHRAPALRRTRRYSHPHPRLAQRPQHQRELRRALSHDRRRRGRRAARLHGHYI